MLSGLLSAGCAGFLVLALSVYGRGGHTRTRRWEAICTTFPVFPERFVRIVSQVST